MGFGGHWGDHKFGLMRRMGFGGHWGGHKYCLMGRMGFGGHWGDHEYYVVSLWVSPAKHPVLWSKHSSICSVNNAYGFTLIPSYTNLEKLIK